MIFCRSRLVGLMAGCLLCACGSASRNGSAFAPLPPPTSHYDSETAQVFVKDARRGVSKDSAFDTPFFSLPGDGESRAVPLSAEVQAAMAARLKRLVPRVGRDHLYFQVYVRRADAGWIAHWWDEEARATAELQICAFDGTDDSVLAAGSSDGFAYATSADVTDGEPARLLDMAVLYAWARWIQNDNMIAAINRALAEKHRWGRLLAPVSCGP